MKDFDALVKANYYMINKLTHCNNVTTDIESNEIGKGVFAYALTEKITDDFIVPDYISNAVLWACGGKSL